MNSHELLELAKKAHVRGENDFAEVAANEVQLASIKTVREMATNWLTDELRKAFRKETQLLERQRRERWLESPEGTRYETARIERESEIRRRMISSLNAAVETYAEELKAEWAAELLNAEIALPDGSRTTWGEATIEQHQARVSMFDQQIAAGAEASALHRKAIRVIVGSGSACLNDALVTGAPL